MELKTGNKLICRNDFGAYELYKNEEYIIEHYWYNDNYSHLYLFKEKEKEKESILLEIDRTESVFDYFYTIEELRKVKLEKLNTI